MSNNGFMHVATIVATLTLSITSIAQELMPAGKSRLPQPSASAKTQDPRNNATTTSNRTVKANALREHFRKMGGIVQVPASGPKFHLIDATASFQGISAFNRIKEKMDSFAFCETEITSNRLTDASFTIIRPIAKETCGLVVLIDGNESSPVCALYPEDHCAVIALATLCPDKIGSGRRQDRIVKETWRAIGHICNIGSPDGYQCVMQPIKSVSDIDSIPIRHINPISFIHSHQYFDIMGVKPPRRGLYEKACREGWAPKPTNDIQRTIWERVHALPAEPLKIEFDPTKGE